MNPRKLILEPIITERATKLREQNKYLFSVRIDTNRVEVKKAVEEIFKVKVKDVNIQRVKGKVKRLGRFEGKRADWKKAIVTLKEDHRIELFEGA